MSYGRLSECWQGRARKMELVDENPLEKRMKSYYFKATGTSFLLITLVSVEVCCSGAFSISQGRCNVSGVRSGRWRVGFAATGVLPRPGIFSDRGPYNNGQRIFGIHSCLAQFPARIFQSRAYTAKKHWITRAC